MVLRVTGLLAAVLLSAVVMQAQEAQAQKVDVSSARVIPGVRPTRNRITTRTRSTIMRTGLTTIISRSQECQGRDRSCARGCC